MKYLVMQQKFHIYSIKFSHISYYYYNHYHRSYQNIIPILPSYFNVCAFTVFVLQTNIKYDHFNI